MTAIIFENCFCGTAITKASGSHLLHLLKVEARPLHVLGPTLAVALARGDGTAAAVAPPAERRGLAVQELRGRRTEGHVHGSVGNAEGGGGRLAGCSHGGGGVFAPHVLPVVHEEHL